MIYGLSEHALFQVNNLVEGVLEDTLNNAKKLLRRKTKLEKQIDEVDSYLTLDINDQELKRIHKRIKNAEQVVIDDQVKIAELEQKRSAVNTRLSKANSEFNKQVEAYLEIAEIKDSADRITKYSNIALDVIRKYQVELQKRKTNLLSATITDCYLR